MGTPDPLRGPAITPGQERNVRKCRGNRNNHRYFDGKNYPAQSPRSVREKRSIHTERRRFFAAAAAITRSGAPPAWRCPGIRGPGRSARGQGPEVVGGAVVLPLEDLSAGRRALVEHPEQ